MRSGTMVLAAVIICAVVAGVPAQEIWVGKDGNVRSADIRAMVIAGDSMYLATRSEVYRSMGENERWESVFALPPGENEIRCAACRAGGIFIGTKRGVMMTGDGGATWQNVFRTIIPEKSDILCVSVSARENGRMAIGGQRGAYMSDDGGRRWLDISGTLRDKRVSSMAFGDGALFAAGDGGIFTMADGSGDWERVYAFGPGPEDAGEEAPPAAECESDEAAGCGFIAAIGSRVYACCSGRIAYSEDIGRSWLEHPAGGIAGRLTCMLASRNGDRLYCGTTRGVFQYVPESSVWKELYKGAERHLEIRSLVSGGEDDSSIWAVTGKGLFRFEPGHFAVEDGTDVERAAQAFTLISDEDPPFEELQKAAMSFNDVDPEKIKRWQTESRLSALVPKISVGLDNSTSNSYEIYTSATRDYIVNGPDDISSGMDFSISWELGKVLWSDDQTNIDVRSRLTTQLRNDILDDLRRAYYERKRLQYELIVMPPKDARVRFEKELRVQELAQVINDLTGNYMVSYMKVKSTKVR